MEDQPDLDSGIPQDESGEPLDNTPETEQSNNPWHEPSPLQRMHRLINQPGADDSQKPDLLEGIPKDAIDLLKSDIPPASNNTGKLSTAPGGINPEVENSEFEFPEKANQTEIDISHTPTQGDSFNSAESLAQSMRDRGYLLEEDVSGPRLSGAPVRRGKQTSMMSANELVQLAAEMEGGILPPEKRIHCPHCDAVVKQEDKHCPWCSKDLSVPPAPKE